MTNNPILQSERSLYIVSEKKPTPSFYLKIDATPEPSSVVEHVLFLSQPCKRPRIIVYELLLLQCSE